jgi:hypothetical protein
LKKEKTIKERYDCTLAHKRVNAILAMQRQNDIIAMLLDGKDPAKEIRPYVCMKYRVTPGTAAGYITEARNIIKQRKHYEVNNLVSLHLQRYEEVYKFLKEINAHGFAMKALRAKEKLLGFHREGFHMKVTQGDITSVQLQTVDSDYNVSKLSKEKRDQLSQLLNKARRDGRNRDSKIAGRND